MNTQVMDNKNKYSKYLPLAGAGALTVALSTQPAKASGGSDPISDVTTAITNTQTAIGGLGSLIGVIALIVGALKVKAMLKRS